MTPGGDDRGSTDRFEALDERPQAAAAKARGLRSPEEHPPEQQGQDGDQGMHHELLIGPVILRAEGADPGVFQIAAAQDSGLGIRLPWSDEVRDPDVAAGLLPGKVDVAGIHR